MSHMRKARFEHKPYIRVWAEKNDTGVIVFIPK